MKILSIDYGKKYIGLAVSDELEIIAAGLPYLKVKNASERLEGILFIIDNVKPGFIVLGKPQKGKISEEVDEFAKVLEKETSLPVVLWNEDYSSKNAEKGRSIKFKKAKSHSEAARIVLQEYLDSEFHQRV